MRQRKKHLSSIVSQCTVLALVVALIATTGMQCPTTTPGIDGLTPTGSTIEGGNSFNAAAALAIPDGETLTFNGTAGAGAPDVFDLGPVNPGDRVMVEVRASTGSTLDPVIAIFDANESLFSLNDDINFDANDFDSAIDDVVTVASNRFFLVIAKFFLDNSGGAYVASVRIDRGDALPNPAVQTLLLDFAGNTAIINNEGTYNLDPFDAADIDPAYAGKTTEIKATIVDTVRDNFSAFGMIIVTTDENPNLTPGTYSTLFFGAFSPDKFGVADDVDFGNLDRCDDGIIFTNGFDNPFASRPSPQGIAIAIGNVAAHEAGHLLGLSHVADVSALMDNTGTASTLLADQNFKTAPLSPSVFPIGNQDAPALLERVIPN